MTTIIALGGVLCRREPQLSDQEIEFPPLGFRNYLQFCPPICPFAFLLLEGPASGNLIERAFYFERTLQRIGLVGPDFPESGLTDYWCLAFGAQQRGSMESVLC